MTDDELKRLEALCEKASPAPWHRNGKQVLKSLTSLLVVQSGVVDDLEFIAAARSALPAALAEIRRLRGLVKDAERNEQDNPAPRCPWCMMRGEPLDGYARPFGRIEHSDDCPAFTPDGKVK